MSRSLVISLFLVGACGGGDTPPSDTNPANKVQTVACASNPPSTTIMATGTEISGSYMPSTVTISTGQVVQFVTTSLHNVAPNAGVDPGLTVGFNATACLKFTAAGTFGFHCGPHGFTGTVTVN